MPGRGAGRRRAWGVGILVAACVCAGSGAALGADPAVLRERWKALVAEEAATLAPRRHREAEAAMKALDSSSPAADASTRAEKSLGVLDEAVRRARTLWRELLEKRDAARREGAPERDPRTWTTAENILVAAAQKLETDRVDAARAQASGAGPLYDTARRNAMRAALLSGADSLRVGLETDKARHFVPRSYVRTVDAIAAADRLLRERDRMDDEVRAAGARATSEARHARFLLDRVQGACQDKAPDRIEASILEWEEATRRALEPVGIVPSFETGLAPALGTLEQEVVRLRRERDRLRVDTVQRAGTADTLAALTQDLRDQIRDRDLQIAELRRQLADHETTSRVAEMFTRDEGRVFVEGRDVILRLHGVRFESGKADITPAMEPLLHKVVQAVGSIPGARLIVEGHTDSQGQPAKNIELSQQRAEAVRAYLVQNLGLDPREVTATGYGSRRPVASEDTEDGRALNRRIEIVIARVR